MIKHIIDNELIISKYIGIIITLYSKNNTLFSVPYTLSLNLKNKKNFNVLLLAYLFLFFL